MSNTAKAVVTLSVFLGLISVIAADENPPPFEDFAVSTPRGKETRQVIIDRQENATDAEFQQRKGDAAKAGPNFAGHYVLIEWSCGAPCASLAIVDVRTRRVHDLPFLGVGQCRLEDRDLLSFRVSSRLLILNGSLEIPDEKKPTFRDGPCGTHYYEWTGGRLRLIRFVPAPPHRRK